MTEHSNFHEVLGRSMDPKPATDRSFGLVFTVVFAVVGSWPLIHGQTPRWWSIGLAVVFLILALARPVVLAPLNRIWMAFGRLLHSITTPLVMGILFALVVTPTALLMRCFGKVPLKLRFDRAARSYWILRTPRGPAPDTMNRQF